MQYRPLGSTGIRVSAVSFGAGPVPELMTAEATERQVLTVGRAVEAGINWCDTAATYGEGRSEASLGEALRRLGVAEQVHVATKVRLMPEHLSDIGRHVRASVAGSLQRLGVERVTLLQIHNSITGQRGDEPTSITPRDMLGRGGVLDVFGALQREGRAVHLGLTGLGQPAALREVLASRVVATIQVPYNVLNPSAGRTVGRQFSEADFGNLIAECAARNVGVFAIRVFAGGALLGNRPSAHTHRTKFFPLDLYRRDAARASRLQKLLGPEADLAQIAIRFALSRADICSAIVGFGEAAHVDAALGAVEAGPLPDETLSILGAFVDRLDAD